MNQFLKEILEQPKAIENVINFYTKVEGLELSKPLSLKKIVH
ncbi:MAG: hypothetical protein WC186_04025 [Bacteroidales bacterium]